MGMLIRSIRRGRDRFLTKIFQPAAGEKCEVVGAQGVEGWPDESRMLDALCKHWPEHLIGGCLLRIFLISAGFVTSRPEYLKSPLVSSLPDPIVRRFLLGTAMGLAAIALIFSPFGKRSGARMNPATILAFLRLGKIRPWDALFYILAQPGAGGVWGAFRGRENDSSERFFPARRKTLSAHPEPREIFRARKIFFIFSLFKLIQIPVGSLVMGVETE
jgi:hypothetical protein